MKTAVVSAVREGGSGYGEPESQAEVSRFDLANVGLLWFLSREGDDCKVMSKDNSINSPDIGQPGGGAS